MGEGNGDLLGVYHNSCWRNKQSKTQSLDTEQSSGNNTVEDEDVLKNMKNTPLVLHLSSPTYLCGEAQEFRYTLNN